MHDSIRGYGRLSGANWLRLPCGKRTDGASGRAATCGPARPPRHANGTRDRPAGPFPPRPLGPARPSNPGSDRAQAAVPPLHDQPSNILPPPVPPRVHHHPPHCRNGPPPPPAHTGFEFAMRGGQGTARGSRRRGVRGADIHVIFTKSLPMSSGRRNSLHLGPGDLASTDVRCLSAPFMWICRCKFAGTTGYGHESPTVSACTSSPRPLLALPVRPK